MQERHAGLFRATRAALLSSHLQQQTLQQRGLPNNPAARPLTTPMHPRLQAFFRNFMTLLLLGVVGTWMTAAMVATGAQRRGAAACQPQPPRAKPWPWP